MKKFYFLSMLLLAGLTSFSQITATSYRGAFAPAPAAMWTDSWTNYDPQNAVYPTPNVDVTASITTNTAWTAGNTYYLKGQIYVKNNATLTIEPGVVIRADHTATGAGLFVTKGAKVMAIGTATSPIVFTSDNAVGSRNKGDWGGVVLLGKGSYNINNGVNNIEGIAASADTQFGGGLTPDDNDNSGTLQYVRIEYGGYVYAANQEINGLTFGAVGRGTTIDYVQVSNANDDSFEWFGGAVNCKHLVAFRGLDDDFDTDNGFSGSVQFCLGVRDPNIADNPLVSTSEGFESDNNATGDSSAPITSAIFSNCTMIGPAYRSTLANGGTMPAGAYKRAARLRKNTKLKIFNSIFMDYLEGLHIDNSGTAANGAAEANAVSGQLVFKSNILAGITTTAKIVQISTTGTHNASFNIATWFNASNNTGLSTPITNAGILTLPYNTADGSIYTNLDYRPAASSIALTGADFTDASLGTDNFIASSEFSLVVYPNPSANSFKLNYFSSSDENVKVAAYDLTGRLLESRNVKYEEINNQEIGNGYTSGVYIVVLKQGNISKSVRVIKN
ncbi:T9SS type A sorting domain-containing protein [Flavobacterium sp.]|uniref:T9SS type A sorting domain-containing protein n=1 Tax=Flavobacterium sp. TaxID=239 RepID=UPI00375266C8